MPTQPHASLIDSHVHTDDHRLEPDLQRVLLDARAAGIIAQIVPGVTRVRWPGIRQLCAQHSDLHACYGLHPCYCQEHQQSDLNELAVWLGRENAIGVGECGLDYAISAADKPTQQHFFAAQLAMAREFNLPVVIHARKALQDVIQMIRTSGHHRGMVHSFSGSLQQATQLIDLGYKLGFGGATTYERASRLRKLVAQLPLNALLLETDAPDQPGAANAKQRNEPAYLLDICKNISDVRNESAHELAQATTQNAIDLFNLPLL